MIEQRRLGGFRDTHPTRATRSMRRVPKRSVSVADGRLYYRTEDGTVLLIEPSRKEYLERGRFLQPDRTRPPAWGIRKRGGLMVARGWVW